MKPLVFNEAQWLCFKERLRPQFSGRWAPPPIVCSYEVARMLWGAR